MASGFPEQDDWRAFETPAEYVAYNSQKKVEYLVKGLRARGQAIPWMVIGGDTVVCLGSQVLEKPLDRADAIRMLQLISGQTLTVYSAVHASYGEGKVEEFVEPVEIEMHAYDLATIEGYLALGNGMYPACKCARAYLYLGTMQERWPSRRAAWSWSRGSGATFMPRLASQCPASTRPCSSASCLPLCSRAPAATAS